MYEGALLFGEEDAGFLFNKKDGVIQASNSRIKTNLLHSW